MDEEIELLKSKVEKQAKIIDALICDLHSLSIEKNGKITFSSELTLCLDNLKRINQDY